MLTDRLVYKNLDTIFYILTGSCMYHQNKHPWYTLEKIIPKILLSLSKGKNRIFATHFLWELEDMALPRGYLDALGKSDCTNRERKIFGKRHIYEKFIVIDTSGFRNSYTSDLHYQRMLLIDAEVFFREGDLFYQSTDPKDIQYFLEYFHKIDRV